MTTAYQHRAVDASSTANFVSGRDMLCLRGGRSLFAPLTFTLNAGQSLLVSGPNGAGKSSLIRMIGGLLPACGGTLAISARCAMTDENSALDDGQSLHKALLFWAMLDGAGPSALEDALSRMALAHLRDVPVRMLSTGQRKRAMLARVLASGAPLWLLDEPGNGLDAASLALLGEAMSAHVGSGGAIIAASHLSLPFAFAQEIVLTPDALLEDSDAW
jgi:heme exporter protein A